MLTLRMQECQELLKTDILEHHTKLLLTGATLYLGSTLVAMSAHDDEGIIWMARILMFNASLVLIAACSTHFSKDKQERTLSSNLIYGLEILGYLLLGYATMSEQQYNRGPFYMVGSFLISIAKELVIVKLLVPKTKIKEKQNLFLSSISSCSAALLFFFGALVMEMGMQVGMASLLSNSLNSMSGCLICLSIVYMVRGQAYDGYQGLQLTMDG